MPLVDDTATKGTDMLEDASLSSSCCPHQVAIRDVQIRLR